MPIAAVAPSRHVEARLPVTRAPRRDPNNRPTTKHWVRIATPMGSRARMSREYSVCAVEKIEVNTIAKTSPLSAARAAWCRNSRAGASVTRCHQEDGAATGSHACWGYQRATIPRMATVAAWTRNSQDRSRNCTAIPPSSGPMSPPMSRAVSSRANARAAESGACERGARSASSRSAAESNADTHARAATMAMRTAVGGAAEADGRRDLQGRDRRAPRRLRQTRPGSRAGGT